MMHINIRQQIINLDVLSAIRIHHPFEHLDATLFIRRNVTLQINQTYQNINWISRIPPRIRI